MKQGFKLLVGIVGMVVAVFFLATFVKAGEFNDEELYEKAVTEGKIDSSKYPLENFLNDSIEVFHSSYQAFRNLGYPSSSSLSYEEWLQANNYGVMPDTKYPVEEKKVVSTEITSGSKKFFYNGDLQDKSKDSNANNGDSVGGASLNENPNIQAFCNTVRAGDILIVSGSFPTGVIGHAAIMNSNNTVLEMSGGSNWESGIPDNNHQYSKREWIANHISAWTSVYRISDSNLARKVANYADTHFFSSNGSATKDIHIKYFLDRNLKSVDPNYCSKLVYQAYYYGSGNLPVMQPTIPWGYIPPVNLPSTFSSSYGPSFVGRY